MRRMVRYTHCHWFRCACQSTTTPNIYREMHLVLRASSALIALKRSISVCPTASTCSFHCCDSNGETWHRTYAIFLSGPRNFSSESPTTGFPPDKTRFSGLGARAIVSYRIRSDHYLGQHVVLALLVQAADRLQGRRNVVELGERIRHCRLGVEEFALGG